MMTLGWGMTVDVSTGGTIAAEVVAEPEACVAGMGTEGAVAGWVAGTDVEVVVVEGMEVVSEAGAVNPEEGTLEDSAEERIERSPASDATGSRSTRRKPVPQQASQVAGTVVGERQNMRTDADDREIVKYIYRGHDHPPARPIA